MEEIITVLLQQGPLGIISGIFIYLYINERSKNNDLQNKINDIHSNHYQTLDVLRQSQIKREQEVAKVLEEYGRGTISAVNYTRSLAEELRRIYHARKG